MTVNIIHFYPDLMNLYGSYANLAVLTRCLEKLGFEADVRAILPEEESSKTAFDAILNADLIFMGAGTERRSMAALNALQPYRDALAAAKANGAVLYFAGTAMELLGQTVTEADGSVTDGLGLAEFTVTRGKKRFVCDSIGESALSERPVIGFTNKCALIENVETPFIEKLELGFGNTGELGAEGWRSGRWFASELTGPLLVKNPSLLAWTVKELCHKKGLPAADIPTDEAAEKGYTVTLEELRASRK